MHSMLFPKCLLYFFVKLPLSVSLWIIGQLHLSQKLSAWSTQKGHKIYSIVVTIAPKSHPQFLSATVLTLRLTLARHCPSLDEFLSAKWLGSLQKTWAIQFLLVPLRWAFIFSAGFFFNQLKVINYSLRLWRKRGRRMNLDKNRQNNK